VLNYLVSKRESNHELDAYEAVFTALAHPARRRILLTVHFEGGSMTAGEIAKMFEHAWPTTTRHLQVLEAAGLLRHQRQGRVRRYTIDSRRLNLVRDWLAWFSRPQANAGIGGRKTS
jgi:DNA-binding transcriptional ArsR family regulator